jgi:hypothetical protein
MLLLTGFCLF